MIVPGNPHCLQPPQVVAEIPALLLAALRSTMLWRQVGGISRDCVFRRRSMMQVLEKEPG